MKRGGGRRPRRTSQKRAQLGRLFNEICFVGRPGDTVRTWETRAGVSLALSLNLSEPKPVPVHGDSDAEPYSYLFSSSPSSPIQQCLFVAQFIHSCPSYSTSSLSDSKGDSDVTANLLVHSVRTANQGTT